MNGATLALPVLGGANERVELYDTRSGSFAGVFRLPRKYDRVQFSPTYHAVATPARYGLELWSPFFYERTTESEEGVAIATGQKTTLVRRKRGWS